MFSSCVVCVAGDRVVVDTLWIDSDATQTLNPPSLGTLWHECGNGAEFVALPLLGVALPLLASIALTHSRTQNNTTHHNTPHHTTTQHNATQHITSPRHSGVVALGFGPISSRRGGGWLYMGRSAGGGRGSYWAVPPLPLAVRVPSLSP